MISYAIVGKTRNGNFTPANDHVAGSLSFSSVNSAMLQVEGVPGDETKFTMRGMSKGITGVRASWTEMQDIVTQGKTTGQARVNKHQDITIEVQGTNAPHGIYDFTELEAQSKAKAAVDAPADTKAEADAPADKK